MPREKGSFKVVCGKRLKTLCEREKITQTKLSEQIYLSQQVISGIVNGRAALTRATAERIVSIYPTYRIEWLLGLDDFMTETEQRLSFVAQQWDGFDLAEELIALHGYAVDYVLDEQGEKVVRHIWVTVPVGADDTTTLNHIRREPPDPVLRITAPDGRQIEVDRTVYDRILEEIDDFAQMRMEHLFRGVKGGKSNG